MKCNCAYEELTLAEYKAKMKQIDEEAMARLHKELTEEKDDEPKTKKTTK